MKSTNGKLYLSKKSGRSYVEREREREDLFADLAEIIMIYMSTDCYAC